MQTYYIATTEGPVVFYAIPLAIVGPSSSGSYITHIIEDPFSEPPQQSPPFLGPQPYSTHTPPNLILCLPYLLLPDYSPSLPLGEHGPGHYYTTEPYSGPDISQPFTASTVPFANSTGELTNGVLAEPYYLQPSGLNISPGSYYPTFQHVDQALEDQAFTLDPLPDHPTQDNFPLPEQPYTSLVLDPNLVMDDFSQTPFPAPPILTGSFNPVSRQTQSCVNTSASC